MTTVSNHQVFSFRTQTLSEHKGSHRGWFIQFEQGTGDKPVHSQSGRVGIQNQGGRFAEADGAATRHELHSKRPSPLRHHVLTLTLTCL